MVVAGLSALMVAWADDGLDEAARAERVLLVESINVERLRAAYSDQQTGQRGFVISGDERFLEPYADGLIRARVEQAELERDLRHDPTLFAALQDVTDAAERWRTEDAEPAIATIRQGGTLTEAANVIAKVHFDQLREAIGALASSIERATTQISREAETDRRWALAGLIFAIVATVGVGLAGALLIQRWVVRPVEALTRGVGAAATRDEDMAIPAIGAQELRQVGSAVQGMQQALRAQRDRAVRDREAIEQNTILALELGEALAGELGTFPPGWSVAATLRSAEGYVAGDCYDVFLLSPTVIGVTVLDIAGHGVQAGLLAVRCKDLLSAALRASQSPGEAVRFLSERAPGLASTFLTAFVGRLDTTTGLLTYANAGHPPPLLRSATEVVELMPTGPLIGPLPGARWLSEQVTLPSGASLVVYTDGLTEARRPDGEFYGEARLADLVADAGGAAEDVLTTVTEDLAHFTSGRHADDATVVVLAREVHAAVAAQSVSPQAMVSPPETDRV